MSRRLVKEQMKVLGTQALITVILGGDKDQVLRALNQMNDILKEGGS